MGRNPLESADSNSSGEHLSNDWHERALQETMGAGKSGANSWTYLVNLTASLDSAEGPLGAQRNKEDLKALAALTENTDARVIVQSRTLQQGAPWIEDYEISDGKVKPLGSHASDGYAHDLTNLMARAPEGGKLALINQGHGRGSMGVGADQSPDKLEYLSVDGLQTAIEDGLRMSGHKSLDVLSLDSCLMGNGQALDKLGPLADSIVASEQQESGYGQPEVRILAALLKHPENKGRDVANTILGQSAEVCNLAKSTGGPCGTPSLGIYDPAATSEFKEALNGFGDALSTAMKDPYNKTMIQALIAGQVSLSSRQERDIGGFAQAVLTHLNEGTMKDDDNNDLKRAAQTLLQANADLVPARYDHDGSAGENHGVNVFLPDQSLDVKDIVSYNLQFFKKGLSELAAELPDTLWNAERVMSQIDHKHSQQLLHNDLEQDRARFNAQTIRQYARQLPSQVNESIDAVDQDLDRLASKDSLSKADLAMLGRDAHIADEAVAKYKDQIVDALARQPGPVTELVHQQLPGDTSQQGWGKFIYTLLDMDAPNS